MQIEFTNDYPAYLSPEAFKPIVMAGAENLVAQVEILLGRAATAGIEILSATYRTPVHIHLEGDIPVDAVIVPGDPIIYIRTREEHPRVLAMISE